MVSDPRCRTFSPRVLRSLCFNPCRACVHRRATSATMSAPDPRLARHGSVPLLRSPAVKAVGTGQPSGGRAGAAGPGLVSALLAAPHSSRTHLQHVPLQHLLHRSSLTCPRLRLGAATEADVEADTDKADRATGDVVSSTTSTSFQEELPRPTTADAPAAAPTVQATSGVPRLPKSGNSLETLTNADGTAAVTAGIATTGTTTETPSEEENECSIIKAEESANKKL